MKILQPTTHNLQPKKGFTPTLTFFSFFLRAGKKVVQSKYLKNISCLFDIYTKNTRAKRKLVCGFTLIETLVAISILLLAIGGPLTMAAQSYFTARFSKDKLAATYLVHEGIELVRYRRDSNSLEGDDWLAGLENCLGNNKCMMVGTNNDYVGLCNGECNFLRVNSNGVYTYNSSSNFVDTKYVREISAEELSETEIAVTSVVKWNNGNIQRQVQLKETLHDWQ